MSKKVIVLSVLAVMALTLAVTAQAEVLLVKQDIKQATVVNVGDNFIVLKLADGTMRGYNVPADLMFDQNGANVPLSRLRPGQVINVTMTTNEPIIEYADEVKSGKVVRVADRTLTVRLADGTYQRYFVPRGYRFDVDGDRLSVYQLKPGMTLSTNIVSENEVETITAAAYEAEAPYARLPKTAGQLPLIGLLGLLSLGLGVGVSVLRRH